MCFFLFILTQQKPISKIGKLEKKKDSFTFTDVEIQIKRCPFLSIGVFD